MENEEKGTFQVEGQEKRWVLESESGACLSLPQEKEDKKAFLTPREPILTSKHFMI